MPTLTMTKGLPASGKTTWAKKQNAKRVNKDDLRAMIDNGQWSKENEKTILVCRDAMVGYLLSKYDVIVDDTNLHPKHEKQLRKIALEEGADFAIKDFTDVPLETCLKRDSERQNPVGRKVIMQMYNQFLKPPQSVYTPPENKPKAIMVDIDGTLAHGINVVRKPYEWMKVGLDTVDPIIRDMVNSYKAVGFKVVLMSGRDSICRQETIKWLLANNVQYDDLWMRRQGDQRVDHEVKKELFDEFVKDEYQVEFVLDDRDQVVRMWRGMGLKVLQVAEGDF